MEGPVKGVEFLAQLREQGGRKKPNFRDLAGLLDQKARQKGIPISGQFELTPLCNLDCKMCYVHLNPDQLRGHSVLSVAEWKDIMHQAFEAGMFQASLTGGECLAYSGFDELYLYLHGLGCEVNILSNGVLLDEKRIQFFRDHRPADIQITLYGWNDDVYERVTGKRTFETVVRNIQMAQKAKLSITLSVTPSIYLGEDALETVRVAKSLCRDVIINPMIFTPREETGRSGQMDDPSLDLYVRLYRLVNEINGQESREISPELLPAPGGPCHTCTDCGIRCGGGRSSFTVDWKGILRGCSRLDGEQGYLLEESFSTVWARINEWSNRIPRVPECKGCPYEEVCNNCAANVAIFAELGKQPIELCKRTMYLVQNGVMQIPECD
ncbi:radical SAM protein [Clostridiales bacterium]|nr:radical SAM protein [Clostridiales bacterium]